MIRVIAFVLSICCCIGVITGVHRAVNTQEENLLFAEQILEGDPSVARGLKVTYVMQMSDHLRWDVQQTVGDPQGAVEFTFSQKDMAHPMGNYEGFQLFSSMGFGFSTSGTWEIPDTPLGRMFQAAYDHYLATGEKNLQVRMTDYLEDYLMEFEMFYESEKYFCGESVSHTSALTHPDSTTTSPTYAALMKEFRFRVPDTVLVDIWLEVDETGRLYGAGLNTDVDTSASVEGHMNDDGIWFVPYIHAGPGHSGQEFVQWPDGLGVYFIPWKETGDIQHRMDGTELLVVTGDVENMRNIYRLADDTKVCGLYMDETHERLVLLTEEEGVICVTFLDRSTGELISRHELMPPSQQEYAYTEWRYTDDVVVVYTINQAAALDTSGVPEVVFVTGTDVNNEPLGRYSNRDGSMIFRDGTLCLVGNTWDERESCYLAVYDSTGLLYYGTYRCSLLENNVPVYHYAIYTDYYPMGLE